jgi:hypothetical protein
MRKNMNRALQQNNCDVENLARGDIGDRRLDVSWHRGGERRRTSLRMAMSDFKELYTEALNAWPPEVRLPVRSFVTGHLVDGLTDLEHAIATRWAGSPREVLMVTLNWTILRAVHAAFATRPSVILAELPSLRERFEVELRLLLNRPHWGEPDRKIIREYFGE